MTAGRAYLDYNATAPLRAEARAAVLGCLSDVGNPSSVHGEGRAARGRIEEARLKVAALAGARPAEVVFTSGATEAAAMVLQQSWQSILFSRVEHPCVVAPVLAADARVAEMPVGRDGMLDLRAVEVLAAAHAGRDGGRPGRSLLVVQAANNETGVLQPVAELAAMARAHGMSVLVDAVQAAGRMAIDMGALGADFLMLSSHKLGGPKGVGALVIREGADVAPLLTGGGQERRRRAGTENVEGIVGFGAAAEAASRGLAAEAGRLAEMRDALERDAVAAAPGTIVVGGTSPRLPNTSCLAMPGAKSETVVIKMDLAGVAVSAGAACSSGRVGQSPVLAAMGLDPAVARAAIRVSLGHATTARDIASFLAAWRAAAGARTGNCGGRRTSAGASPVESSIR